MLSILQLLLPIKQQLSYKINFADDDKCKTNIYIKNAIQVPYYYLSLAYLLTLLLNEIILENKTVGEISKENKCMKVLRLKIILKNCTVSCAL